MVVSSDGRTFLLPLIQLLFLEVVYSWVFCSFLGICLPFVYCFSIASVDVSRVSVSFFWFFVAFVQLAGVGLGSFFVLFFIGCPL